MINIIKTLLAFTASILMFFSQAAVCHQQKMAVTTLLFNQRSGNLEINHRFYIHDAEHAVKRLLDNKANLMDNEQTQKDYGHYVQQHFRLKSADNQPLLLNYVGHEVDGKFFWVYQETKTPSDLSGLIIFHDSLQDIWPSQVNLVNIEGKGAIKSLRLGAKDGWQTVLFD